MTPLPGQLRPLAGQLLELNEEIRHMTVSVDHWEREEIMRFIRDSEKLVAEITDVSCVISEHLDALKDQLGR